MSISIRKFLLLNLLLAITITTTITAIGNYYLDQKDIQRHLDTLMALSTLSYQALLSHDIESQDIKRIQAALDELPDRLQEHAPAIDKTQAGLHASYARNFAIQVWSDNGQLMLASSNAPKIPLNQGISGFSNSQIGTQKWRVFSVRDDENGITTIVAERRQNRDELGHTIAEDDIYIMLLTFPLSGLLIWMIIGKGLSSLNRVTQEVSDRAATYLEPVKTEGVPEEVRPLIEELNKLFARLQQAFEREKRFAADAAHELRTPIAALKTQAQVALMAENETERRESLQKVIRGVDRSTHIITQLLTLSRLGPQADRLDDCTDVCISELAAEIIAQLAPSALVKHIDIEMDTTDQQLTVFGNVTALSILIRNLVDNAIRYTDEGGEVKVAISLSPDQKQVIFSVCDNGPGIPDELRSRVFERFFRVLGNKSPGSGLGLSIVQQIASLHGARVNLAAPVTGSGLIIEVFFPRQTSCDLT